MRPTQGKNLTGPARRIRDLTADIHAGIQQWNTLHLHGVTLLKAITQEKQNESYSQGLQKLCDELEIVCDGLVICLLQKYLFVPNIAFIKNERYKIIRFFPG